jgi:hypothetical protein
VLDYVAHADGPKPGILQIWEGVEGALSRPKVTELTKTILGKGIWVSHLYLSHQKKLFFPKGKIMSGEMQALMEQEGFVVGIL